MRFGRQLPASLSRLHCTGPSHRYRPAAGRQELGARDQIRRFSVSTPPWNGTARIYSRGGHDWTERYGSIAEQTAQLSAKHLVVDGEMVVLREDGTCDYWALQTGVRTASVTASPTSPSICSPKTAKTCGGVRFLTEGAAAQGARTIVRPDTLRRACRGRRADGLDARGAVAHLPLARASSASISAAPLARVTMRNKGQRRRALGRDMQKRR